MYDVCACQGKLADCLCPSVASYAKECTQKGVLVDWIPSVRHCGETVCLDRRARARCAPA